MSALTLPDIANQASYRNLPLDWVGMARIAIPVLLHGQKIAAKADAGVSLDDGSARGIHMSRLYLALEKLEHKELTPALLQEVLQCFLETHAGLSNSAYLHVRFELLVKRSALVSERSSKPQKRSVPRGTKYGDDIFINMPVLGRTGASADPAAIYR